MSEADFLKQQAADAKAAIGTSVGELVGDLGQIVDPRAWTRRHPWLAMGAAALGGFVVVTQTSSPRSIFEHVKSAVHPGKTPRGEGQFSPEETIDGNKPHGNLLGGWTLAIARELFTLIRPILSGLIAAQMSRYGEPSHNGHSPDAGPVPPSTAPQ